MNPVIRAYRVLLSVEAGDPITVHTGQLVKTLVYAAMKELTLFKGLRGVLSPVHISPLFTPGQREYMLGEAVTPTYNYSRDRGYTLNPVEINGDYIAHIGGEGLLVEKIIERLISIKGPLSVKFKDTIITYKIEKTQDITETIQSKKLTGDRITVYLKAPAKIFNIFAPTRLPKFSISAPEILATPCLISKGTYTVNTHEAIECMTILGQLVETYYSLTTVKPILVSFKTREPAMIGKITYIIEAQDEKTRKRIEKILHTAEITGIGESRTNGFGTITWTNKYN